MNTLDAAFNLVHDYPGGAESLGPRVGKNATTLNHELKRTGTAKLGLDTAEKITLMTGDLRILQAFATNCGQMLLPLPCIDSQPVDDCMAKLGDTAREFGELCQEVAQDLADGSISDNEMRRIDRASGELIATLHSLRESLARRNVQGRPANVLSGVAG